MSLTKFTRDTCLVLYTIFAFWYELNSKLPELPELLNLPINQSQLNIKLAFNFQRQSKNSTLNLSCIEK
jgi:hypothetical protein